MLSLADRIEKDRIRVSSKFIDTTTDGSGWQHHLYRVTLKRKGRQWTLDFRQGIGHTSDPTTYDVLNCILSDASGILNCTGFADWADDYGYNPSSSKARETYDACRKQTDRAWRFFNGSLTEYLENTD